MIDYHSDSGCPSWVYRGNAYLRENLFASVHIFKCRKPQCSLLVALSPAAMLPEGLWPCTSGAKLALLPGIDQKPGEYWESCGRQTHVSDFLEPPGSKMFSVGFRL